VTRACGAVGLKRATYYRAIKAKVNEGASAPKNEHRSHRRLSDASAKGNGEPCLR
jgi:hypothetical protein